MSRFGFAGELVEGREYCHACERVTNWRAGRSNARHVRCDGCGDVFPCRHACGHLDCAEARGLDESLAPVVDAPPVEPVVDAPPTERDGLVVRVRIGSGAACVLALDDRGERDRRGVRADPRRGSIYYAARDTLAELRDEFVARMTSSGGWDLSNAERLACRRAAASINKALDDERGDR